jgi:hypothetical protein
MIRRWGSKNLGNIEQLLRGMLGARLRRVCHEANTVSLEVRWMPAWITTQRMTEIINVGANNSEIMSDSILVGSISLPSRQRPLRGNVASLRIVFKNCERWTDFNGRNEQLAEKSR